MSAIQPTLTTPIQVGNLLLKNRLVLAPLTRLRNSEKGVPPPYSAEYYSQRANDGGLLISEATIVAEEAGGTAGTPGIYSREQIESWKKVTAAVHAKGGFIYSQLWALGRVADPKLVPTVFSSSTQTYEGNEVKGMTEAEIDRFVVHFAQAAKNAIEAGFDGVEIHGANGYLIDQFIQNVSNKRTDDYGGSVANRIRFPLRVLNAVCDAIGPERVGIRMSPYSKFQGMEEERPLETFVPYTEAIVKAQPKLAYVHCIEPRLSGDVTKLDEDKGDTILPMRKAVDANGQIKFIAAGGLTPDSGEKIIQEHGGLVALGRWYLANPDLLQRAVQNLGLNQYDRSTFYTEGEKGYTDYPTYEESGRSSPR
ncbi:hypothetical protein CspeluHIS016_0500130 [Cutaneotrichosporon spelunceum]|uniref:NADH:flavin oxidoreductase/NADH oxidase N-terminal domain-containing protein n=1 Tax=Cutaneotrichosporon spelunceum TaxID=1672016 RepID=A0AAD3YCE3_9TREE|nr:hypothetical protein CspeluHIS016_0500130 [Cutaneotrichosporon spelunceum]